MNFLFFFIYIIQNQGLRVKLKEHEDRRKNLDEETLLREQAEKQNQDLMEEITEVKSEASKYVRFEEERYVINTKKMLFAL